MKRMLFVFLPIFVLIACEPVDGEECDLDFGESYCDGNTLIQCQGNSKGEKSWRVIECGKPYPKAIWEEAEHNPECVEFTFKDINLKSAMCVTDKDLSNECKNREDEGRDDSNFCYKDEYHTCIEGYLQSSGGSCEN